MKQKKNVWLWLLFGTIILSNLVSATYTYSNENMSTTLEVNLGLEYHKYHGVAIKPTQNLSQINVFTAPTTGTYGYFYLLDATFTGILMQINISGTNATFNYNLTNGTTYAVAVMNESANIGQYHNDANHLPIMGSGGKINFTRGFYNNASSQDNYVRQIINISVRTGNESPDALTIAILNPSTTGQVNNTQINITLNCSIQGNKYDLWFQNITPPTTKVLNNVTTSFWVTNVTNSQTYYFFARCYNTTSGTYSANTSIYNWTYDLTFPTITINNPNNFFKTTNYSNQNQYKNNISINLTFTDNNNLFAFEINITKNGISYFNISNSSLGGVSYTYYKELNITTWGVGTYNISVFVSDSHTDKEIPEYLVTEEKNKIKFKTQTENEISIYTLEDSNLKANKKKDRYSIDVSFKTKYDKDRLFHITSTTCPLKYIENSPYKAHFVSLCNKDGNWVDFEGVTENPFVNKIDDYHYTIYYPNLQSDVTFNSIGGLNIYSVNFTWYRGNYSFDNVSGFINHTQTFYLNMTFDSTTIANITALLIYNGSAKTTYSYNDSNNFYFNATTTLPSVEAFYNFSWNVTISQKDSSQYNFTINSSHYVYNFILDDCNASNVTSIWIYYFNESTPKTPQNNSLEVYLTYWVNNPLIYKTINLSYSSNISHRICIYPNTTIFTDAYFKYNNEVYTHRYYLLNHSINNSYQTINMFNIDSTTGISLLKLTTRRTNDYNYYKNVVTTLQRFYVGEGVWRTIQMDESGDFGIINFDIIEKNTDYRLIFIERSSTRTLKQSESMKFVCSAGLCDLTYLLNPDTTSTTENEVLFNVTANTTGKIINISWNDSSGTTQTINLKVWKPTITGIQTICDTTQTANAGSFGCNATNYNGLIYVNLKQDGSNIFGSTYELAENKLSTYLPSAEGGFYAMLIMVLCLTFGLFSPVGSIISGVFGLIIIYWLGIFNPLTFTGVAIAVVIGAVVGFKVKT